jgi:Fe2+ transport system protein B
MGVNFLPTKKFTVRISGVALEKISEIPANNISRYIREAIIEKSQHAARPQINYDDKLAGQIAQLASVIERLSHNDKLAIAIEQLTNVIENLNTVAPNIAVRHSSIDAGTNLNQEIVKEDICDAERERILQEMVTASAFNILNNGWGNASNGEK